MLKTEPIMLIEENPNDVENILGILKSQNEKHSWFHFRTTAEALEYMENKDILPQLIILGLKNRDFESIEFLRKIKADYNLRKIPLVIMASSTDQNHVLESFNLGVAGYIVKSQDITELAGIISTMMRYWNLSELPSIEG